MNRFKNINYILIITAICFIGALILGNQMFLPKFQQFNEVRKNIGEKRSEITYSQEYYSKLVEVDAGLKKYSAELSQIDSALPNDSFLPSLFNYLQKATAQSGLVLKDAGSFNISVSGNNPKIKDITLGLEVSGPYSSFKNFLSTLEKSARLFETESISFTSSEKNQTTEGTGGTVKTEEKQDIFNFSLSIKVRSY